MSETGSDRSFKLELFLGDDITQGKLRLIIDTSHICCFINHFKGIDGGKFLERQRIKKPNQPRYPSTISEVYTYKDLHVGAVVHFNNFQFHLYDADEYCFKFMEQNMSMFPYSNVDNLKHKLMDSLTSNSKSELINIFKNFDVEDKGQIDFNTFFGLVKNNLGNWKYFSRKNTLQFFRFKAKGLNDQEVITLGRYFSYKKVNDYDFQSVIAVCQDHLRKHNFENFSKLRESLVSRDVYKTNVTLPPTEVRNACKGMHLPLPDYALDLLLQQ